MMRILLVEDDAALVRTLSTAIATRHPDFKVLNAKNGVEAKSLLRDQDVDVVLTELQLPEMNGFELLAWLLEHRSGIAVFTMTAHSNEQTESLLAEYGPVACFSKPVDTESVIAHLARSASQGLRGQVRNLSLPAFLQLLELERSSCTLTVQEERRRGVLFIREGELWDARVGHLRGEPAALAVLSWSSQRIIISGAGSTPKRVIDKPISFVIMEALRLQDERAHQKFLARHTFPPVALDESSADGMVVPNNAAGMAVVDLRSGVVLAHGQRPGVPLSELSAMAVTVLRNAFETLSRCGVDDQVEEIVLTTQSCCELIRRLPGEGSAYVIMVFNGEDTTLAAARLELDRVLLHPAWLAKMDAGSQPVG